ncbi:nitrogenase molybdenum-iron protein alpha chain [Clostridium algifaecis]|uniref:Nitrogenase molybdenum-iron protein alpha chain n=1 Tax=Clostridium algifaecis TaxID=1472040 RepID=A0ABS4KSB9_9CLOT|nr:nitrogenase component 1 [Clostridium algifaecis]MBP2032935.1 nitrogenase molybdenum-iron protein alpha chain [Clostridium algifaecis]
MSVDIERASVQIREQRLSSITGYNGTARDLCDRYDKKDLHNCERSFTQCTSCSANQVMNQICCIQDAAIVEHGPAGCSGDIPGRNLVNRSGRKKRNLPICNLKYINTNLTEKDMVYGGERKLEDAIREANKRFKPKAIFVTTTCASAIIGDDIESITNKVEKEIGIPVVDIYCEGFRSAIWATGFDAAYHGILRKIVKPPRMKKLDEVNIINFQGKDIFTELLGRIGLKVNYIVPFTTIEELSHISEAAATLQICSTLGTYLGAGLEKYFGVPEVKAPAPYGISGTNAWLRELGRIVHKEKEVEKLIEEEREKTAPKIAELREKLSGKKVFIGAGAAHGHGLIAIVKELGMDLVGSCTWHHDPLFDNGNKKSDTLRNDVKSYGDFKFAICNKQSFELVSMLYKYRPDIYIARHTGTIWATKLGIPSFLMGDEHFGIGYQGLINYGELILDTITNPSFVKGIAAHNKLPYTDWWLNQYTFKFLGGKKSE